MKMTALELAGPGALAGLRQPPPRWWKSGEHRTVKEKTGELGWSKVGWRGDRQACSFLTLGVLSMSLRSILCCY